MQKLCVSIAVRLLVSIVAQAKKNLSIVMAIGISNARGSAFRASLGFNHNDNDRFPSRAFRSDHPPLLEISRFIKKKICLSGICDKAGVVLKFG